MGGVPAAAAEKHDASGDEQNGDEVLERGGHKFVFGLVFLKVAGEWGRLAPKELVLKSSATGKHLIYQCAKRRF